jgi:predicted extracellular nuclease
VLIVERVSAHAPARSHLCCIGKSTVIRTSNYKLRGRQADATPIPSSVRQSRCCPSGNGAETLRFGTWNVKWFFDHRTADNSSEVAREMSAPSAAAWNWRVAQVAAAIADLNPDILALQEIEDGDAVLEIADELATQGNQYQIAFVQGDDTYTEQDVAFLVRDGMSTSCSQICGPQFLPPDQTGSFTF